MLQNSLEDKLAHDVPVCLVNCINQEIVNRLKPQVDRIDGVAAAFKALADDTRVKVIFALSKAELCVCDVAALLNSSKATASYHLRLLHHLGIAKYRKDGKMVCYRLANTNIGNLMREILSYLERGVN
ncbi:metalloregulator ArsR/SmtB family transcription factor [Pelotomaculum terephthalicicum JT]|uniref:ArsR/SmtB family transcription factor n=1 Tax=Pelotomaculum TaxID=191373 RepID=UPI0009D1175A|nr:MULTISPECIES: metalloregulator ArsR/SmtB family transcription factor [Pelotomaculum]MCG9966791.1 metalloregulator ArsR/SmtB family transcription factor [Pelotomaculum terephthalicicum JT]OPX91574.1 MAG: hypothetical protein A4E54_00183 [Pelotomaculum sp. PtaB.Bin117]OPY62327.1 MAG: hypothetical protein A4E56_01418 [Pelotomaculum sp. PtaU1.Bin065]